MENQPINHYSTSASVILNHSGWSLKASSAGLQNGFIHDSSSVFFSVIYRKSILPPSLIKFQCIQYFPEIPVTDKQTKQTALKTWNSKTKWPRGVAELKVGDIIRLKWALRYKRVRTSGLADASLSERVCFINSNQCAVGPVKILCAGEHSDAFTLPASQP